MKYRKIPKDAIKVPVPDTRQRTHHSCGAAALQSICAYYGIGPEEEKGYIRAIRYDHRVGSHPDALVRQARRYGLRAEAGEMSLVELRHALDRRRPVLCLIQAWDDRPSYRDVWSSGHYVIAIGYDETGVYFEDPSLASVRGFLSYRSLAERWHDTVRHGRHVRNFGIVIWSPRRPRYLERARHIG